MAFNAQRPGHPTGTLLAIGLVCVAAAHCASAQNAPAQSVPTQSAPAQSALTQGAPPAQSFVPSSGVLPDQTLVPTQGASPLVSAAPRNLCPGPLEPIAVGAVQWNGWGHDVDNTRYQPEPAIRAADVAKLALKWAYGHPGGTRFGQPTIVDGRLFVSSSTGRITALDAKTGCTYWTYDAAAGSSTAISIGELGQTKRAVLPKKLKRTLAHLDIIKAPSAAFFGDDSGAVYALDAKNGTLLWKTRVDTHPLARIVGSPTLYNDRLYVTVASTEESMAASPDYPCCTFRGSLAAIDIASGRVVWKTFTVLEEPGPTRKSSSGVQEFGPAGAAIVSSPTIDSGRNVVYVATGNSLTSVEQSLTDSVAAFGLADGKLRWVKQLNRTDAGTSSGSFASSPILRTLPTGNQILLAGQRSGVVYGLDPDHGGEILWQTKGAEAPGGGVAWGAAADHRNLYVALSGQLAQPANASGSLTALDIKTGAARWRTPAPDIACTPVVHNCAHGQSQAVTVMPGSALSGSLDGHLRAYSTIDGKIVWDFDTAKEFQTLNGVKAAGGPLDHGGATIVNGVVYINSGNALLAFSVDGK